MGTLMDDRKLLQFAEVQLIAGKLKINSVCKYSLGQSHFKVSVLVSAAAQSGG